MVNLTEMVKLFGKLPKYFLKTQQTQNFIKALSDKIQSNDKLDIAPQINWSAFQSVIDKLDKFMDIQ